MLSASSAAFAAALLDARLPCPPGLRAWNGSDPGRRFDVHRNNVLASLAAALADAYPVVAELVGADFFRAMAVACVRRHPPRSPVLALYGAAFPDFVAGFGPAAGLAYLADVARLERARVEACHAPDGEGPETPWLQHPSLRVVRSAHPVVSIWAAHQGQGALEDVDLARPECALVARPQLEVLVVPCDAATAASVLAARPDATIGAGSEAAA